MTAPITLESSYFLSGLVRADSSNGFAVDLDYFAMGFSSSGINNGFHLGIRRDDSLGGSEADSDGSKTSFFDLGSASVDTTYMIVVELVANTGGADSFNAWIGQDGSSLTPGADRAIIGNVFIHR